MVHEDSYTLNITDSSGLDDHKAIRQTMYRQADVVIFCFSLAELEVHLQKKAGQKKAGMRNTSMASRADEQVATSSTISLASVRYKWIKEVLDALPSQKNNEDAASSTANQSTAPENNLDNPVILPNVDSSKQEGQTDIETKKAKTKKRQIEYWNCEGNKMTFLLVGTKSDKVFENFAIFDE